MGFIHLYLAGNGLGMVQVELKLFKHFHLTRITCQCSGGVVFGGYDCWFIIDIIQYCRFHICCILVCINCCRCFLLSAFVMTISSFRELSNLARVVLSSVSLAMVIGVPGSVCSFPTVQWFC
eukprot:TRINITY_DN33552_c0_g1_i1.p1 TRINITY_DN33552_c0_g1~~TRINITY_DN33552_c0_g1_i1.p1  ORF type:complete len:130 (+),score=24.14 TRINITY_DN33552_c0_g1_i1:26-391(+)